MVFPAILVVCTGLGRKLEVVVLHNMERFNEDEVVFQSRSTVTNRVSFVAASPPAAD